jgi:Flp pilus assembly protein TadB
MVRVEEELKHQRELMQQGFAQMDKRFESVQQDIRELQRRMDRFMVWSFGTTLGVGGLVVTLVKFWNPEGVVALIALSARSVRRYRTTSRSSAARVT